MYRSSCPTARRISADPNKSRDDTDPRKFNLSGKRHLIVTVYVNDLMILSDNVHTIDWLLTELIMRYNQLKITL